MHALRFCSSSWPRIPSSSVLALALMSCAPSTGLYLADLETPRARALARKTKVNCAKVLKARALPLMKRDLTEAEVAALITRRSGDALDCAEPALSYVEHVTRTHKALAQSRFKRKYVGRNGRLGTILDMRANYLK